MNDNLQLVIEAIIAPLSDSGGAALLIPNMSAKIKPQKISTHQASMILLKSFHVDQQ